MTENNVNFKEQSVAVNANTDTYGNMFVCNALTGDNPKLNLADRGLVFVQPGVKMGAGSRALEVNLVYNSQLGSVQDLCGGMPQGWKLDAHQFLMLDGADESGVATYKYIDPYGYVHTFVRYSASPEEYSDAEGMGYTLKESGTMRAISDVNGNKMYFDSNGRLFKTEAGINSSNVKSYSYSGDQLVSIRDERAKNTYISFAYSSGILSNVYVYYNSVLKATLNLTASSGTFSKAQYKVNANATEFKVLASFGYTSGKLTLITDEVTKAATRITYSGSAVTKLEQGYNEGGFVARTYMNVSSSGARTLLKSEKNVYTSYYIDGKGNVVSVFESDGSSENDLHTTSVDAGISLNYAGTSTKKINGHKAQEINKTAQTTTNEVVVSSSTHNVNILEKSQNVALNFWVMLAATKQRANLTVKATLTGGSVYSKTVVLNQDAVNAWQQVSVPIARGTKSITKITVSITDGWGENVHAYICNFYLRKGEERNIYFSNGYTIDDLESVTAGGLKYLLKLDPVYLTENDILNTLRAKAQGGDYVIFNNGKKRFADISAITFKTTGGATFNMSGMTWCRLESTVASNRKKSTKTYTFTSSRINVEDSILAARGDATLDSATSSEKSSGLVIESYDIFGNKLHESDIYGKATDYEYNDANEVIKITESADGEEMVVYNSTSDTEGYMTAEMQGFDAKSYTYNKPFGTIDNATERSYNVNTGTYSNTTYKTKNTYNGYYDELIKVAAQNGNTQICANEMTYPDGNSITVTDGKVRYKGAYANAANEVTWSVYEVTAEKVIKKQSVTESASGSTGVEKYYNTSSGSPAYTETTAKNKYGRITSKGGAEYNYDFLGGESPSCYPLDNVQDSNTGTVTGFAYTDGSLTGVQVKSGNTTLVNIEKLERLKLKYTFGGGDSYQMLVGYDDAFAGSTRVKSRVVTINNRVFAAGSFSYEYDGFGRVTSKTNGRETYTYKYLKGMAMPTECVYKRSGMTDRKSTYAYDNRGRITEESEQSYAWDYAKEYTYDGLNRLTGEKISKQGALSLNRTYTYDGDGRMAKFGNDVVTYDSRGRISKFGSKSYTYDNYGNRISDGTNTYTWVRGRLLSSVGGASFTYNADGRRYTKAYGGVTATYYYDEDMLLGENRSDGKKLRYFYDSEGMCGFRYYNGSAWTEYVYVKNAKGDVLAILNGSGTVVANYSYDAWGNCTIESQTGGMGDINPIRYRGYYYDGETGLYYLLTRYYDPAIGHFISPDGFEYLDPETIGTINLYAYCCYNPINNIDPNGTFGFLVTLLIATVAGAAVNAVVNVGKQLIENEWDFSNINFREVGASALKGAALGLAFGFGGIAGAVAKGALSIGVSIGQMVAISLGANLAAGMGAYAIQYAGTDDFNAGKMLINGFIQTGEAAFNFLLGGMFSSGGIWNVGNQNRRVGLAPRVVAKFLLTRIPFFAFDSFVIKE